VKAAIEARQQALEEELHAFVTSRRESSRNKRALLTSSMVSVWRAIDFMQKILEQGSTTEILFLKSFVARRNLLKSDRLDVSSIDVEKDLLATISWKGDLAELMGALETMAEVSLGGGGAGGGGSEVSLGGGGTGGGGSEASGDGSQGSAQKRSKRSAGPQGRMPGGASAEQRDMEGEADGDLEDLGPQRPRSAGLLRRRVALSELLTSGGRGGHVNLGRAARLSRGEDRSLSPVASLSPPTPPPPMGSSSSSSSSPRASLRSLHRDADVGGSGGGEGGSAGGEVVVPSSATVAGVGLAVPVKLADALPEARGSAARGGVQVSLADSLGVGKLTKPQVGGSNAWNTLLGGVVSAAAAVQAQARHGDGGGNGALVAVAGKAPGTKISLLDAIGDASCSSGTRTRMIRKASDKEKAENSQKHKIQFSLSLQMPGLVKTMYGVHGKSDEELAVLGLGRRTLLLGEEGRDLGSFRSPCGMAVDKDHIFIADTMNHRIQVFERFSKRLLGQLKLPFGTLQLTDPSGLCYAGNGQLAVVQYELDRVLTLRLSPTKMEAVEVKAIDTEAIYGPFGCGFTSGRLVVADSCNHRCLLLSTSGRTLRPFGSRGSGPGQFEYPECVATFGDGCIAVSDKDNHRIQVFSIDGEFLNYVPASWTRQRLAMSATTSTPPGMLKGPMGMVADQRDRLYVCDCGGNRVQIFTRSGRWLWSSDTAAPSDHCTFRSPTGIAIDEDGHIYVASDHCVQIF